MFWTWKGHLSHAMAALLKQQQNQRYNSFELIPKGRMPQNQKDHAPEAIKSLLS
jgi:hypothetical protein